MKKGSFQEMTKTCGTRIRFLNSPGWVVRKIPENSCLFGGGCDIIVKEVVGNNFMDIKIETVSEEGTDLLAPSCDFVFR
ncbi:MAG: hypothetical protein LBT70_03470, partial [Holosporaceae bacterium]|nr:hypothetical protein [Holosporaceae bacterium]